MKQKSVIIRICILIILVLLIIAQLCIMNNTEKQIKSKSETYEITQNELTDINKEIEDIQQQITELE